MWIWGKSDENNLGVHSDGLYTQQPLFINIKVEKVAGSSRHTFAWKDNAVYCWGSNLNYELGLEGEEFYKLTKSEIFEEAIEAGYQLK